MMYAILARIGLIAGMLSGSVGFGGGMILGNFLAMKFISNVDKNRYRKVVAIVMIAVSLWLFSLYDKILCL
ncbi:MAG: hypothetical protein ACOX5T_10105 [Candidatus Cryptobacteroides sp.]|jgi:uncharacterized membrane protein YfcA